MHSLEVSFNQIVTRDIRETLIKDAHYESSWKRRGGAGAFFTIVRPWDRFEAIAKRNGFDLFKVLEEEKNAGKNGEDGTLLACIRDLRCYMMLLEAELMQRTTPYQESKTLNTVSCDQVSEYLHKPNCVYCGGKGCHSLDCPEAQRILKG